MLIPPINSFNTFSDNFGVTFTEAAMGTGLTAGGTNHTKNVTITSILAAVGFDVYGIAIGFHGAFVAGSSRRYLTDIYTDPAGGTAWGAAPVIANLAVSSIGMTMGGKWYYFPLYVKTGASFGATCQAETASATCRILIRVFGKPSHPETLNIGRKVVTLNAATASTFGTQTMSAGASNTKGGWSTSLGTTVNDIFWWQFGMMINDTSQTAQTYFCDVAIGDASNKIVVINDLTHNNIGTGELAGEIGECSPPLHLAKAGAAVYIRCASSGTADASLSGLVYGVVR